MHFHGRTKELGELEHLYRKRPSMAVLVGRRRVGKTTLIHKILEAHGGLYFYIDKDKGSSLLLEEFSDHLSKKLKLPAYIRFGKWADLYRYLLENYDGILAFDEFQRLLDIEPAAISELQNVWDTLKKKSRAFVILSGSNVGMIKRVFSEQNAPLFKRADNIMKLKPFAFGEVSLILRNVGIRNITEQIRTFAVFGGVPYYYELMEKYECRSTMDAIVNLLLREFAPLRTETRDVMIEGFGKDHPTYRSIISAIALGKTTKKEIGDFVEIKETSLSPYLYDLMEMADLVEYEIPVTEKKVWKTKRGRYVLKDPFFEFWFRFIFRNRSAYEIGNYDYLKSIIREQLDSFVGFGFEKVVREAVLLKKSGVRAGRWWNRKGDEIDLVCLNGRPVVIECKWQDKVNAAEELGRLKAKVALAGIPGEAEYLIVARSFLRKEDYCWDLGDLQRAFSGENPASS